MGKIQDAIRKVQQIRNAVGSIESSSTIHMLDAETQLAGDSSRMHDSIDRQNWEYSGANVSIDTQKLINCGLLDPDHARKHLANEYRQIKRTLLASIRKGKESDSRRENLISISSADPGEGRSFIALNLAMSLSLEAGHSVVLVDGNFENAHLSKMFGMADQAGLSNLLADDSLVATDIISATSFPGLAFLSAGTFHEKLNELLAEDHAAKFFETLAVDDPRRVFIFDSSPMMSSPTAQVLAGHLGQVLFIVKAGKTPQATVIDALEKLDRDRPIHIILNQVID